MNSSQIIDKPCKRCGDCPAEYYRAGKWFHRVCVKCRKADAKAAWIKRGVGRRSGGRALLERPCRICQESPAVYPAHPGNADGYRLDCIECRKSYHEEYRQRPDVRAKALPYFRRYSKERCQQIKAEVFAHYGGFCYCCGIDDIRFLTLDRIHDDGAAHRRETKAKGLMMYYWAKKNGFPPMFRVACFNCNCARQYRGNGICPHEEDRKLLLAA